MSNVEIDLEVHSDPAWSLTFDLNGTGKALAAFSVILLGWCMKNVSSSTEATLDIYDGTDATGVTLFPVNLASNETSVVWFGDRGILMRNGVYVNVTAQEVKGALFYRRRWPGS